MMITERILIESLPDEHSGKEGYKFVRRIAGGKKALLKFDKNQGDKYRRFLACVFLEERTFINTEIVKQGYGYV